MTTEYFVWLPSVEGTEFSFGFNNVCVHAQLCPTLCNPWTETYESPLSMEFPRQEYWSGLPFPPPGDLLDPGVEPTSPGSPTLAGRFFTTEPPGKSFLIICLNGYLWLVAMTLDSSAISIVLQLGFNPVRNMLCTFYVSTSALSLASSDPVLPCQALGQMLSLDCLIYLFIYFHLFLLVGS